MFLVIIFTKDTFAWDLVCPHVEEGAVALIPNPESASVYFECDAYGGPYLLCCPLDTYFCSEKQVCSWEWDKDCSFNDTKIDGERPEICDASGGIPTCIPKTCNAPTAWVSQGNGLLTRTSWWFDSNPYVCSCVSQTEYKCASGYYGNAIQGTCNLCPETIVASPASVQLSFTVITDCYIPSGTGYSDNVGTFDLLDDCNYVQ